MKLLEAAGWVGLGTIFFGTAWLIGLCFAITKSEDFGAVAGGVGCVVMLPPLF